MSKEETMDFENHVYTYDFEEIDDCIDKMSKGITPAFMDDALMLDIKMRRAELQHMIEEDDDEEEITLSEARAIRRKIEQNKRKASTNDVIIIKLSDEQKQQIHDDMSSVFVRNNYKLRYHKSDEEIFDSKERKELYQKLAKLQTNYYSVNEWIDAMKVIIEAIKFSLDHDYPWLNHEQAVDMWNKGKIEFKYCPIPALYTSWTTMITDPSTLKGILNGEITVQTSSDRIKSKPKRKKTNDAKGVYYDYAVVSPEEFEHMRQLHQQGYNTPISAVIKASRGTFSRFSLPESNYFYTAKQEEDRRPVSFDWLQDDAGKEYYRIIHGKQHDIDDLIDFMQDQNDHQLSPAFRTAVAPFLESIGKTPQENAPQTSWDINMIQGELERASAREIEIEKNILNQMTIVT
jgi:hypothetical protein